MTLIETLAQDAGISVRDATRIILSAPKRYKVYTIPKRHGGERTIAQPAFEVKVLQRLLMMRVLTNFPVHDAAYAYVKGRSIRQNAMRHVDSDFILKLDFKNFFNSIRPVDLERTLRYRSVEGLSPTDYEAVYQLLFWGRGSYQAKCLSIGAPSSPMVSNVVMYEFDRVVAGIAIELGLTYTRYADDLTISGNVLNRLLTFERRLASVVQNLPMDLALNDQKRGLYGRGQRRMVTGLIITPDHKVSIGRERKRAIRAAIHRYSKGEPSDELVMRCKGMLGFVLAAEPSHISSLVRTFGRDLITSIKRAPQISLYKGEAAFVDFDE